MGYNLVLKTTQCELWTRRASVTSPSIYKIHKASGQTAENDHFRFNQTAGKVLTHWVGRSPSAIGPYLWLQWTFSSSWTWAHGLQQMNRQTALLALMFKNFILHSVREKSHVRASSTRVAIDFILEVLRWQQTVLTWKVVLKDTQCSLLKHPIVMLHSIYIGKLDFPASYLEYCNRLPLEVTWSCLNLISCWNPQLLAREWHPMRCT